MMKRMTRSGGRGEAVRAASRLVLCETPAALHPRLIPSLFFSLWELSQECFHSQAFKKGQSCTALRVCVGYFNVYFCVSVSLPACGHISECVCVRVSKRSLRSLRRGYVCVAVYVCVWAAIDRASPPSSVIGEGSNPSAPLCVST